MPGFYPGFCKETETAQSFLQQVGPEGVFALGFGKAEKECIGQEGAVFFNQVAHVLAGKGVRGRGRRVYGDFQIPSPRFGEFHHDLPRAVEHNHLFGLHDGNPKRLFLHARF